MTSVSTETVGAGLSVARKCTNETPVDYTYVAGCTDPAYQNENCPKKANYIDYAWVGLVKCTDTDSSGQVSWVGCVNDGSPTVMKSNKSEGCTCDHEGEDPDQELFRAPTGLDA